MTAGSGWLGHTPCESHAVLSDILPTEVNGVRGRQVSKETPDGGKKKNDNAEII